MSPTTVPTGHGATPLLEVEDLRKTFVQKRNLLGRPTGHVVAVQGVTFTIERGETVAIVGETGAGKSTVGRMVLRLIEPDSGSVKLDGDEVLSMRGPQVKAMRKRAQMIFQEPFSSLDPRMVVRATIAEAVTVHQRLRGSGLDDRVQELVRDVGLQPHHIDRYPHEMSGGQLQRVSIARALAPDPELIVCDEPVSALDVLIQAQVLNLLLDLQEQRGLGYLFISHDLAVVRHLAHRTVVMRKGEVVEQGETEELFNNPRDPYTRELVESVPDMGARRSPRRPTPAGRFRALAPSGAAVAPAHPTLEPALAAPVPAEGARTW